MNVVRFCRANSRAVYLLTGLLAVAGLVSVFRLPSGIYPELTFPRIVIIAHAGDLSPQNMLLTVTRPEGLFYMLCVAPQATFPQLQGAFQQMLNSVRFSGN